MLFRRLRLFTLALISSGMPCLASDVLLPIADGRVFGHLIDDEGSVVLGTTHGPSNFQTRLVLWTGTKSRTLEVDYGGSFPILFKDIQAASAGGDTFILRGAMKVDDSDHGAVIHRAYRMKSSGELQQLWSIDTSRWIRDEASLKFSPDGTMWGAMAHHATEGRHFAFGSTKSMKTKRSETLEFHPERPRLMDSDFRFLSSDGPVILAPYGDDVYLLRFHEFGVASERIDQLKSVRTAYAGMLFVRWQPNDRVLWANDGREWAAWDLWDLGLSGFPEEPFLRFDNSSGEPHPVRGFVRKAVTERGYRVEHVWRSPSAEHLVDRHMSEWKPGRPLRLAVSPNGRYAAALEEVREYEDGEVELRQVLRRFELVPEPPPPTRTAAHKDER